MQQESNSASQDDLYERAVADFGAALERLVRAYEMDVDKRQDLYQDIHMALWSSFGIYESRCSLRTWVYRVAHNTAAAYILRQRRARSAVLMSLEELETIPDPVDHGGAAGDRLALDRLLALIQRLRTPDRQLMLLYLEDMDADSIAEIAGLSPANVRTKLHRIRQILARRFHGSRL